MKRMFLGMILILLGNCSYLGISIPIPEGEFGYTILKPEEETFITAKHFGNQEFEIAKQSRPVYDDEKIYLYYNFSRYPFQKDFSLFLEFQGFSKDFRPGPPITNYIDRRTVTLEENANYFRTSYENLELGEYKVVLVHENTVLDSFTFRVIPRNGYASLD